MPAYAPGFGCEDELSAAVNHIPADIVVEGAGGVPGASDDDVVGGVGAVAAGAVGGKQVVPAVMVGHLGCFAGQGDIDRLAAFLGESCLRVELEYPYVSEICPVAEPQPSVRAHEESGVDAVAVFETVRTGDIYGLRILEVRRFGIHGVVPHHVDPRLVSVAYASICDGVDHEVAVSYLDCIGCDTATGTHCAALPVPAVFRQESSASGT